MLSFPTYTKSLFTLTQRMSKTLIATSFNKQLGDFISDLMAVYPQDETFKLAKKTLAIIELADERKPIQVFSAYVPLYREKVRTRDESFLLNDSHDEIQSAAAEYGVNEIIDRLKNYWREMALENKEAVWKYLQVLIALSDKYIKL